MQQHVALLVLWDWWVGYVDRLLQQNGAAAWYAAANAGSVIFTAT